MGFIMMSCVVPVLCLFDSQVGKIFFLGYRSINSVRLYVMQ